jgi:hypothetical protein
MLHAGESAKLGSRLRAISNIESENSCESLKTALSRESISISSASISVAGGAGSSEKQQQRYRGESETYQ